MAALRRPLALIAGLLVIAVLLGLGTWQVQRLAWKEALIAQVDARIHAASVPAPASLSDEGAAYTRVTARGRYIAGASSLAQAATARGSGYWVLSPLRTRGGLIILINRGFVPTRAAPPVPTGVQIVTGLLRISEPGGGFLRDNDPAADRWYSRDVPAIAAKRGLAGVAPYFIDAEATGQTNVPNFGHNPGQDSGQVTGQVTGQPIAGLTVVQFPNNHLVYAITWYILAAMAAAALLFLIRQPRRERAAA